MSRIIFGNEAEKGELISTAIVKAHHSMLTRAARTWLERPAVRPSDYTAGRQRPAWQFIAVGGGIIKARVAAAGHGEFQSMPQGE